LRTNLTIVVKIKTLGYIREKSGKGEHMKNLIITSTSRDPFINQAIEYYLLTETQGYEQILYLWVNSPCVFVGRNQNPWKEVNLDYLSKCKYPVLRRKSGGGTVYHDEGNLNISFIQPTKHTDTKSNLSLLQKTMEDLGVHLIQNDRFDLRHEGKKVSGSAFYIYKKRKLHHCTLLLKANEDHLWNCLRFDSSHIKSSSIRSVKSPVSNLLNKMKVTSVDAVIEEIIRTYNSIETIGGFEHTSTDQYFKEWSDVHSLADKFRTKEWIYGETPDFTYETPNGVQLSIKKGKVISPSGDTHLFDNTYFDEKQVQTIINKSKALEGGNKVNLNDYNPLTDEMVQVMDKEGNIVHPELMPDLSEEQILHMYKTMVKSRVTDIKTLQFQRQGRILTYAPNLGQEAAQVGTIAASEKTDWVASAFRELGAWLYREAPLYNILLYWLGNEDGMKMPDDVRILPVSVPIASQLQHATGLAYAAVYKGEKDVVLGYVGDGGTSQGDFHEALNFGAVMNVPTVFIVQNNQFAISTRRAVQTKAKTIAQKALAYGMPGYQVDGNDIFAVYAVTKIAVDRARSGGGPTLIEAYTYRLGAHTTADDPTVYRDEAEVEEWKEKDPIDRLRKYLIGRNLWDEEKDEQLKKDFEDEVRTTFEKVEKSGLVPLEDVFDYQYAKRTENLENQYQELKHRAKEAK